MSLSSHFPVKRSSFLSYFNMSLASFVSRNIRSSPPFCVSIDVTLPEISLPLAASARHPQPTYGRYLVGPEEGLIVSPVFYRIGFVTSFLRESVSFKFIMFISIELGAY